MFAFITAENEMSVKLFEKLGYDPCSHFKNIGEKFNRLLDVQVFQKEL
jgi:phosphinothricin acetyltransferase